MQVFPMTDLVNSYEQGRGEHPRTPRSWLTRAVVSLGQKGRRSDKECVCGTLWNRTHFSRFKMFASLYASTQSV